MHKPITNRPEDFTPGDPDAILMEAEAARWLRLSVRSLQRMRLAGGGPEYLQLGERRLGYRMGALRDWIASRTRASTSAPWPMSSKRGAA